MAIVADRSGFDLEPAPLQRRTKLVHGGWLLRIGPDHQDAGRLEEPGEPIEPHRVPPRLLALASRGMASRRFTHWAFGHYLTVAHPSFVGEAPRGAAREPALAA